jgi:hypothetical protein
MFLLVCCLFSSKLLLRVLIQHPPGWMMPGQFGRPAAAAAEAEVEFKHSSQP